MLAWLWALLGRNKKPSRERYVLREAKVDHYHDEKAGGWRWVRYDRFADREDPKGERMDARHSPPLDESTPFAEATEAAQSFGGEFSALCLGAELLEHLSVTNAAAGTRSGLYRWRLPDGSLLSHEVRHGQTASH